MLLTTAFTGSVEREDQLRVNDRGTGASYINNYTDFDDTTKRSSSYKNESTKLSLAV